MSSYTKMQELAVDLPSSGIKFQNESEAIDLTKVREIKVEEVKDSLNIDFSNKIVGILDGKCENHNKAYERKVTLSQLKDVYRGTWGFEALGDDCSVNKLALARVNMFLKIVGERKIASTYNRVGQNLINASLEDERDLDMSPNFYPDEEDFISAENDIRAHSLNDYDFSDVNSLYLETEEEIKAQNTDWLGEMIN